MGAPLLVESLSLDIFEGVTACGTQRSCPAGDWSQVGFGGLGNLFQPK